MRYIKSTIKDFIEDDCPTMAAALAYYTVFSLPPLLLIVVTVAGAFFGQAAVEGELRQQIQSVTGPEAAGIIQTMIQGAQEEAGGGLWAQIFGISMLLVAATTAFAQLQFALNRAWDVEPEPESGGIRNLIGKRLLSFGMILAIAFLLLVSLILSAVLAAFGDALATLLGGMTGTVMQALSYAITFGVVTVLFAAMFKVLPDAYVRWRYVWVGAAVTAVLFVLGQIGLGLYFAMANVGGPYGAAASLIIILLWTYYASMIVLFGAEFTQVWARTHGRGVQPERGAVRLEREERRTREPERPRDLDSAA